MNVCVLSKVLTDIELKRLLLRMIHADYKIRPSAKEVLGSRTIRDQASERKRIIEEITFDFIPIDLLYAITICSKSTST